MIFTYILVGFALAADAFAVSASAAACTDDLPVFIGIRAAFTFGLFQFAMPIAGWLLGAAFSRYIQNFDHWLAFGILAFIGGKMVYEAIKARRRAECPDPDEQPAQHGIMRLNSLLVLAVATSVDAMAVGLSYSILGQRILLPSVIIGITTFLVCLLGVEFGKRLKAVFEEWAEIVGGSVLVIIGLKILIEHFAQGK